MLSDINEILKFVEFKTSRSGGSGGQNVNKVSSKVELIFDINKADFLTVEEKFLLNEKLSSRIDNIGLLHLVSQEDRSQLINKRKVILKLQTMLKDALKQDKKRISTKISKRTIEKRKLQKQKTADKKINRQKISRGRFD